MKALFLGDFSPSKDSKESFRNKEIGKLFNNVEQVMKKSEYTVVNLECALTESCEPIKKFGPPLSAPIETAEVLKELKVDLCALSNNHIFDLGIKGIEDTLTALKANGIEYTGWGDNYEDSRKDYIIEKGDERIAIIAVCEHEYSYALDNRMGARPYDEYNTIEDIRAAKEKSDKVIVIYHGGKEYCRYPSPRLMRACRAMARAGADMVLCQHSHCIGCYEKYKGCHILYGQGNFHFIGKSQHDCWFTGLMVNYDTKTDEIEFVPVRSFSDGIALAEGDDKAQIMAEFEARNKELASGEWEKGWHAFCESMKDNYINAIAKACTEDATEIDNAYFGHLLDCEAHTDVWRELFKTWNHTNCIK